MLISEERPQIPEYQAIVVANVLFNSGNAQGRRKHLKLGGGGTTLREHFFLKKKGAFSKNKEGTSLFILKSVPPPAGWFLRLWKCSMNDEMYLIETSYYARKSCGIF